MYTALSNAELASHKNKRISLVERQIIWKQKANGFRRQSGDVGLQEVIVLLRREFYCLYKYSTVLEFGSFSHCWLGEDGGRLFLLLLINVTSVGCE